MAVEAPPRTGGNNGIVNALTDLCFRSRRIVEKNYQLSPQLPRRFNRSIESADLTRKNFTVGIALGIEEPSACSRQCEISDPVCVVVKNFYCGNPSGFEKALHFTHGSPPVIVIALHDYFGARKRIQKAKILKRIFKRHSPRNIPRNDHGIFRRNYRAPVFLKALHIVIPAAKNVHRFIGSEGKMRISDCEKRHIFTP